MSEVKLMSRTDTKFTFSARKFFPLLKQLNKFYSILEIDGLRIHNYKSRYFDTDERKFYLDHHNKYPTLGPVGGETLGSVSKKSPPTGPFVVY